jgi:hydroxymethylbilane synthase
VKHLRIGTRGSELALWQARHVRWAVIAGNPGVQTDLEVIVTSADEAQGPPPAGTPAKAQFTKEIEDALLAGSVDLAVHSLKDMPIRLPEGLALAAVLEREDPADALITRTGAALEQLPEGAVILTGSARRAVQLRHWRPDLKIEPVRGNVPTRIRKFRQSQADGIVLAAAGLIRLGLAGQITQRLDPEDFLPACGQGALAVEVRADDHAVLALCQALNHPPTWTCVTAERAFLAALGSGCRAPVGAYARMRTGDGLPVLTGMVADAGGVRLVKRTAVGAAADAVAAEDLGRRVADLVRAEGIEEMLA